MESLYFEVFSGFFFLSSVLIFFFDVMILKGNKISPKESFMSIFGSSPNYYQDGVYMYLHFISKAV